jgi:bifunctional non-homologous end joining protein LigD
MSLDRYVNKRDFSKTAEPKSGESHEKDVLRFVVQKHDASHLHYDFRLEMEGVLKSWAVPKGPSTDPEVKRLAMMVEDHPYDYRTFEGIIPEGQYGGGTVIVWDEGTFEAADFDSKDKHEQEKHLLHGLYSGNFKFILHGKKLKGQFALVKAYGRGENSWLLMKLEDKYASEADITKKDKSVISGLTIAKVAETSSNVWNSNREDANGSKDKGAKSKDKVSKKKDQDTASGKGEPVVDAGLDKTEDVDAILKKATKSPFPDEVKPMLATLVDEPFDSPDFIYEVKWDGYRSLALMNDGDVNLQSRNSKPFNEKFYPIHQALAKWKMDAVLDGEIVVLNDKGLSDFGGLQQWRSEADGELMYYVFDLLWYQGKSLMGLPLMQRRAVLQSVLPEDDHVRLSQVFNASGTEFFAAADKMGLEGIIAKKIDSIYSPDLRSKEWLKIKTEKRQEAVIAGYTHNEGSKKKFSALLMGVYDDNGEFQYIGPVGTGFTDKLQTDLVEKLKAYETDICPFKTVPDFNKPSRFRPNPPKATATWVKPVLVGEVSFREMTKDGVMRHPSFKGLRDDKDASEVIRESEIPVKQVMEDEGGLVKDKVIAPPKSKSRKTLLNPKDETQVRAVNGHELKFTNLSKVYWPEDGVTKRDMLNYYYQVAPFMIPYLKDRPQSLNRFPNGIHGQSFYQKNVSGKVPPWVQKFPYHSERDGQDKEFLVGSDEASLLYMASLGCIEMNPWFSRVQTPDNPDWCVVDLDPDKNTFEQVVEAALEVKKVLDAIEVPSYVKTSGSTGIHIYMPLDAKYTYDQSQMFAKLIVKIVHKQIPDYTSLERTIANRGGKMYLDFLQNRPGATIAGPYSLRPKLGATVSMPLHWDEVKPGLKMRDFNIFNAIDRLRTEGDLFKGSLGKGINMEKALEKAQALL